MKKTWNKKIVLMMAFTASISMTACTGGKDLPVTQDPLQITEESYQEDLTEDVQEELTTEEAIFLESELQTEEGTSTYEAVEDTAQAVEATTEGSSKEEPAVTTATQEPKEDSNTVETQEKTKAEETTTAPVTEAPTTHAPVTEGVTTEAPTTEAPSTEAPTTEAPVPVALSVKVKGDHYIGDTLSAGDFTITVTMSDGNTKKNPAGWAADQLYLGSSQTVITVTYQGLTAQVTVEASERPTQPPTEAPTDPPVEVPIQPQLSFDRAGAEAAWSIQKGIIESQAFNLDTMDYTGYPIQWSERLYDLACQRAKEIVDNFSHDGFHVIDASAENIAKNVPSADMVINGWYNSSGHKKNMLGGWDYGAIAKYGNYWVALFSNTP